MRSDSVESRKNKVDEADEIKVKVVDKRSSTSDETDKTQSTESAFPKLPTYVESLQKELDENKQKMIELSQLVRKSQKENEDFRLRLTKDIERRVLNGKIKFLEDMLELLDNLERGLNIAKEKKDFDSFFDGIEMVKKQFQQKLKNSGVMEIESIGEDFDPKYHDAISTANVDKEEIDGKVIEEAQKGYILEDQVLRPSKVIVGKFEKQK